MSSKLHNHAETQQDEHVEAFNTRAQPQLNRERQAFVDTDIEHRKSARGGVLDITSPVILTLVSNLASHNAVNRVHFPKVGKPSAAAPSAPRVLRVALTAAATAALIGVAAILANGDANKLSAWADLAGAVCTAATAAGLSSALVESIRKMLLARAPELLQIVSAFGSAVWSSAAVAGTYVGAYESTKALYHFLQGYMANQDKDAAASQKHYDKAKELATLDTLCRVAAASATAAVIAGGTAAGLLPAAGAASVIAQTVVFWVATSIVEYMLERKNHHGGWLTWFRTFFQDDMRPLAWVGETFEERESKITEELQCNITHEVVVDPVRHVRTGALYERHAIYTWIDRQGKDPLLQELVTRRDYIASPLAKALAREVSEDILGATLALAQGEP